MNIKEKAWNLFLLILFPEALVNLSNKNKQRTPTPNMKCHQTEQSTRDALRRDIHIPKGVYCLLVLDWLKFTRFQGTKTSANKRFLLCPHCFTSVSDDMFTRMRVGYTNPLFFISNACVQNSPLSNECKLF